MRTLIVTLSVVFLLFLMCGQALPGDISFGLIAWWPFDEGSGSTAFDASGNGNDLLLVNGATWAPGLLGTAFDSTANYAVTPYALELELGGSYSLATFVRASHAIDTMATICGMHWCTVDDDGSWTWSYVAPEPESGATSNATFREFLGFGIANTYGTDGSCVNGSCDSSWGDVGYGPVTFEPDEWVHLAFVYDSGLTEASVYINGVLARHGVRASQSGGSSAEFTVGTDHRRANGTLCGSNHYFPGQIDDLRIYDRALDADEVREIIEGPASLLDCQGIDGAEVLFVNGKTGVGEGHAFGIVSGDPLYVTMHKPDAGGNGKFVVHMNAGWANFSTLAELPFDIGVSCFPFLFSPIGDADPAAVWNNLGKENAIGSSTYFGASIPNPGRAPVTVLDLPAGDVANMPIGSIWTVQSIVYNPAATSAKLVSLSNAIEVTILP